MDVEQMRSGESRADIKSAADNGELKNFHATLRRFVVPQIDRLENE